MVSFENRTSTSHPETVARTSRRREAGFSLIEVMIAQAIFASVLIATGFVMLSGSRHQAETETLSDGLRAVRDIAAEMQELANREDDLAARTGISALYSRYNGLTRQVKGLPRGRIAVAVHADEPAIPSALGGPQDLNFDGDTTDSLGGAATGIDLRIVPVELTLSYQDERGPITRTHWLRITRTSN